MGRHKLNLRSRKKIHTKRMSQEKQVVTYVNHYNVGTANTAKEVPNDKLEAVLSKENSQTEDRAYKWISTGKASKLD